MSIKRLFKLLYTQRIFFTTVILVEVFLFHNLAYGFQYDSEHLRPQAAADRHPDTLRTDLFKIVGPIIVGPSSSHTEGARALAELARNLFGAYLRLLGTTAGTGELKVRFFGSFAATRRGHKSDVAVSSGLLNISVLSEDFKRGYERIQEELLSLEGHDINVSLEDVPSKKPEDSMKIQFVLTLNGRQPLELTCESKGGGAVELISFAGQPIRGVIDGSREFYVCQNEQEGYYLSAARPEEGINFETAAPYTNVLEIDVEVPQRHEYPFEYQLASARDLLDITRQKENWDLFDIFLHYQKHVSGFDEEEILRRLYRLGWHLFAQRSSFERASHKGLTSGLIEKASEKLRGQARAVGSRYYWLIADALLVMEANANMELIVTAPTAGSAGVLAAIFWTYSRQMAEISLPSEVGGLSKKEMVKRGSELPIFLWITKPARIDEDLDIPEALTLRSIKAILVAAGIGAIIEHGVPLVGAKAGCQAEVGTAAAMAAAALAYMERLPTEAILSVAALALNDFKGTTCCPVAGLVEIPCLIRNPYAVILADMSVERARRGARLDLDEVIAQVRAIGERMPLSLKETAHGELARTPTGLRTAERMGLRPAGVEELEIPTDLLPDKYPFSMALQDDKLELLKEGPGFDELERGFVQSYRRLGENLCKQIHIGHSLIVACDLMAYLENEDIPDWQKALLIAPYTYYAPEEVDEEIIKDLFRCFYNTREYLRFILRDYIFDERTEMILSAAGVTAASGYMRRLNSEQIEEAVKLCLMSLDGGFFGVKARPVSLNAIVTVAWVSVQEARAGLKFKMPLVEVARSLVDVAVGPRATAAFVSLESLTESARKQNLSAI